MTPACSIPPTMTQHGNARRGGGMRLPAAFHGPDSGRCKKQKHRKDKARWWHERGGGRRGRDYGLEWEKLEITRTKSTKSEGREVEGEIKRSDSCRLDPSPLPMVCTDTEPHQLLFSHSAALLIHPSHPITSEAGLPKRTWRAWWNWGQSEFEGKWSGPLGYGVSCRVQTFVFSSEWHLKFRAIKKRAVKQ